MRDLLKQRRAIENVLGELNAVYLAETDDRLEDEIEDAIKRLNSALDILERAEDTIRKATH